MALSRVPIDSKDKVKKSYKIRTGKNHVSVRELPGLVERQAERQPMPTGSTRLWSPTIRRTPPGCGAVHRARWIDDGEDALAATPRSGLDGDRRGRPGHDHLLASVRSTGGRSPSSRRRWTADSIRPYLWVLNSYGTASPRWPPPWLSCSASGCWRSRSIGNCVPAREGHQGVRLTAADHPAAPRVCGTGNVLSGQPRHPRGTRQWRGRSRSTVAYLGRPWQIAAIVLAIVVPIAGCTSPSTTARPHRRCGAPGSRRRPR